MNSLTTPPKKTSQSEFSCQTLNDEARTIHCTPSINCISTMYIYISTIYIVRVEVNFCRLPFGSKPTKALRRRPLATGVVLCHKGWWWSWFNAWNIMLCGNAMWTALGECCCWGARWDVLERCGTIKRQEVSNLNRWIISNLFVICFFFFLTGKHVFAWRVVMIL